MFPLPSSFIDSVATPAIAITSATINYNEVLDVHSNNKISFNKTIILTKAPT
jgi:hypothetical protein